METRLNRVIILKNIPEDQLSIQVIATEQSLDLCQEVDPCWDWQLKPAELDFNGPYLTARLEAKGLRPAMEDAMVVAQLDLTYDPVSLYAVLMDIAVQKYLGI